MYIFTQTTLSENELKEVKDEFDELSKKHHLSILPVPTTLDAYEVETFGPR